MSKQSRRGKTASISTYVYVAQWSLFHGAVSMLLFWHLLLFHYSKLVWPPQGSTLNLNTVTTNSSSAVAPLDFKINLSQSPSLCYSIISREHFSFFLFSFLLLRCRRCLFMVVFLHLLLKGPVVHLYRSCLLTCPSGLTTGISHEHLCTVTRVCVWLEYG